MTLWTAYGFVTDGLRDPSYSLSDFLIPWLMIAGSQVLFDYARNFDERALFVTVIPFSLMVVGFFPISFSLVIGLEAFVGEKERGSLEPLLATPIGDLELYLGKLLASTALPLVASYSGIALFVLGAKWLRGLDVPQWMIVQISLP